MKYYYGEKSDSVNYCGPFDTLNDAKLAAKNDGLSECWIGEEDFYQIVPNGYSVLEYIAEDLDCNTYEEAGLMWWEGQGINESIGDELDEAIIQFLNKKGIETQVKQIINAKKYVL